MKFIKIRDLKYTYYFKNFWEFIIIFSNTFLLKEYWFYSKKLEPVIIDCGAHIGLSVLYFKKLYPSSSVLAFEPNPITYGFLKKNVNVNSLSKIDLKKAAVAGREGSMSFYMNKKVKNPWSWGDSLMKNAWYNPTKYRTIEVKTVKLSKFINSEIDMLKLDIEGAETIVLKEIERKLNYVKNIKIEFHGSISNKENNIDELLAILDRAEFDYLIKEYTWFNVMWKYNKASKINRKKNPFYLMINAKQR